MQVLLRLKGQARGKVTAMFQAIASDEALRKIVKMKRVNFENNEADIDVEIEYWCPEVFKDGRVTLELLGKFFNIFEIFPSVKPPEE